MTTTKDAFSTWFVPFGVMSTISTTPVYTDPTIRTTASPRTRPPPVITSNTTRRTIQTTASNYTTGLSTTGTTNTSAELEADGVKSYILLGSAAALILLLIFCLFMICLKVFSKKPKSRSTKLDSKLPSSRTSQSVPPSSGLTSSSKFGPRKTDMTVRTTMTNANVSGAKTSTSALASSKPGGGKGRQHKLSRQFRGSNASKKPSSSVYSSSILSQPKVKQQSYTNPTKKPSTMRSKLDLGTKRLPSANTVNAKRSAGSETGWKKPKIIM